MRPLPAPIIDFDQIVAYVRREGLAKFHHPQQERLDALHAAAPKTVGWFISAHAASCAARILAAASVASL